MPCVTGNKKALAAAGQLALVGLASLLPGCSGPLVPPSSPAEIGEIRQGYLIGYLPRTALPDSLQLLPPPPEIGSAAFAADEDIYKATRSYRDSARWQLASQDATLSFPRATEAFICPLGMPISQDLTPHLTILLRRSLADAGLST